MRPRAAEPSAAVPRAAEPSAAVRSGGASSVGKRKHSGGSVPTRDTARTTRHLGRPPSPHLPPPVAAALVTESAAGPRSELTVICAVFEATFAFTVPVASPAFDSTVAVAALLPVVLCTTRVAGPAAAFTVADAVPVPPPVVETVRPAFWVPVVAVLVTSMVAAPAVP